MQLFSGHSSSPSFRGPRLNSRRSYSVVFARNALMPIALFTVFFFLLMSVPTGKGTRPHAQGCSGEVKCPPGVGTTDPICYLANPDACGNCTGNRHRYPGSSCCYFVTSPIVIDLDGTGFHLTDIPDGVTSPILLEFHKLYQISWTARQSSDAWLVLDRDGNGLIDDFTEMFGNMTPQPEPPPGQQKNGFLALAVYDQPEFGGNNDGWITSEDQIFSKLRVWQDKNHDGVSQPDELHTLESVGITGISLHYTLSQRKDQFGNIFRYRSTIRSSDGSETSKFIYDVFLLVGEKM